MVAPIETAVQPAAKAEKPIAEKKASNRRKFRNDAWTEEQVAAKKVELTVAAIPEGWVRLADVGNAFIAAGIAVSRLVRATGGDRGMLPPVSPEFKIVYFGRTRYMPAEVLTIGIEKMKKDATLAGTPRVKKVKAEGETGPVKSAKPGTPPEKPAVTVRVAPPVKK
jgi:hypothetical protein